MSGFALFFNDPQAPAAPALDHAVPGATKVCDALAAWEALARETRVGHVDAGALVPRVALRRRLHLAAAAADAARAPDAENVLVAFQFQAAVAAGQVPLPAPVALELAARAAQLEWGPPAALADPAALAAEAVDRFLPPAQAAPAALLASWHSLAAEDADAGAGARSYLRQAAGAWPFLGATQFECETAPQPLPAAAPPPAALAPAAFLAVAVSRRAGARARVSAGRPRLTRRRCDYRRRVSTC